MESSRQKTFKQRRTARFIFVVFVFISLIYPTLSTANQIKGIRAADADSIGVMKHGKDSTILMAGIAALETSMKRHVSNPPFIPESPKRLAGRAINKSVAIKPNDTDRFRRILVVLYLNGIYIRLKIAEAGSAEVYRVRAPTRFEIDLNWRADKVALDAAWQMQSLKDGYVS